MSAAPATAMRPLRAVLGELAPVPGSIEISDLTLDSRAVRPGAAFLACRGRSTHGLAFAPEAVARGARAILYDPDPRWPVPDYGSAIWLAPVPDLARHASALADRFFDAPSSALSITGITGTNGKTTCCWLLAEALHALGRRAAYLGTLGAGFPPALRPATLTTPDAVTVQRELAALRAAGAEYVAMEVSSHALDQDRVTAVRFRSAAFTQLSRDHLDYHPSMEAYGEAKARLFAGAALESCIVNVDDAFGAALARRVASEVRLVLTTRRATALATPRDTAAWVRARRVHPRARAIDVEIESSFGDARLELPLIGDFNVDNALTVLAILLAGDVPLAAAAAALGRCNAPPGRMETFGGDGRPLVIVDFAHTPDALAKALAAARAYCRGRLWVVFGCGGDRDRGKRPLMGSAATAADEIVLTDDNPRSEDPAAIVAEIVAGVPSTTPCRVIHPRALAIQTAIDGAGAGDVVLVAGKGHEEAQIEGGVRRPFSDRACVRAALEEVAP
jgi:UDP-N-acetylmuramoyl-L-alanyl-D-glutamate--2,6-diaminopimelate ligase